MAIDFQEETPTSTIDFQEEPQDIVASNAEKLPAAIQPSQVDVNARIASRPSMLKDAIQNPISFKEHPFKRAFQDIGAGFETMEAVPASIGLDLQAGKPGDIIPNLGKVLSGDRPAQRGDIFRAINVPEPASAALGLLSGGAPFMPETAVTNAAMSGVSKAVKFKTIVDKVGTAPVAKFLSVFGDVPEQQVKKAIANPEFLSSRWLKQEGDKVKSLYKKVIDPMLNDSTKKVALPNAENLASDLGLVTKEGEWTKAYTSMKYTEQRKILKWEKELNKGEMTFNRADSLLGEIDTALTPTYKAEAGGKVIDYSNDFLRVSKNLRGIINEARKTQYPEVGKVLSRYENWKLGNRVYKDFDRYLPHLMPSIVAGGVTGLAGIQNPAIYGAAILGASPKIQSLGIKGASSVVRNLGKSGAMIPEMTFEEWRQSQQEGVPR